MDVKSACYVLPPIIDASDTVFKSPALTHNIWQPTEGITWDDSLITFAYPGIDCGPYIWQVVMTDSSAIDTSVFTLDSPTNTYALDVQTDDPTKAGPHAFTVKVTFQDYPSNAGSTKDFSILLTNKCEHSTDIVPAAAPADETYTVARPAIQTYFDEFTANLSADPSFDWYDLCPWTYASAVSPSLVAPHLVYDASARTHTVDTADIALAGVYTVTVTLLRPSTAASTFSLSFTITIVDPCVAATFTFDPSILPTPYEYVVSQSADVQTVLDSLVTSSETLAVCPDIVFAVTKRDATPLDAAVFTFAAAAQTLTTVTNDAGKISQHPLTLLAQYDGATYSVAGTHDFDVDVIDPCPNHVTLTALAIPFVN